MNEIRCWFKSWEGEGIYEYLSCGALTENMAALLVNDAVIYGVIKKIINTIGKCVVLNYHQRSNSVEVIQLILSRNS